MSQNMPGAEAERSAVPGSALTAGHPRRWWILGALSLSLMVIGLDLTVLGVALPVLVTDLNATTTELQWIMDSYILVLAALLLPAGSLGDRIGRKRVLAAGLGCSWPDRRRPAPRITSATAGHGTASRPASHWIISTWTSIRRRLDGAKAS
jgi:MFS family permease